ncbi:hypothetical protein ACA081_01065 [Candidatus Hodgkinia cicadicola]
MLVIHDYGAFIINLLVSSNPENICILFR